MPGHHKVRSAVSKQNELKASSVGLRQATQRIAKYLEASRWLPTSNKYGRDGAKSFSRNPTSGKNDDLADYLACAVPLHCMDGWSYLARSLDAQIAGDSARAVHLAYYAELRAGISLLAGRGLGVLDFEHVAIDSHGTSWRIDNAGGTHQFAWNALGQWARTTDAATVLSRSVKYRGINLADWLTAAGLYGSGVALADGWFRSWGADLGAFAEDRGSRNLFSYSPTALTNVSQSAVEEVDEQLRGFWETFTPTGSSPFSVLDSYLLRRALASAARGARKRHADVVARALSNLPIGANDAAAISQFLLCPSTSPDYQEPWVLRGLRAPSVGSSTQQIPGIICRASLLLRFATEGAREIIDDGDWRSRFSFWIAGFGSQSGLWNANSPPSSLLDIRADVDLALEATLEWRETMGDLQKSEWQLANAPHLRILSSAQLVGLWGFA